MRAFLAGVVPLLLLIPSATIYAKTDVWRRLAWVQEPVTGLALASPGTVFAGTSSGTLIRIDSGGQTRIVENFGAGLNPITAIVVDPRDSLVLYVATAQGVFKSVDGGSDWVGLTTEVQGAVAMADDRLRGHCAGDREKRRRRYDVGRRHWFDLGNPSAGDRSMDADHALCRF